MEIILQVLNLELAHQSTRQQARYNLHCEMETNAGTFIESSVLDLGPDGKPVGARDTEWPKFTFEYRIQSLQAALSFVLTSLNDPSNQIQLGQAFCALIFRQNMPKVEKMAILTTKIGDLPLYVHIGKIVYEVYFRPHSGTGTTDHEDDPTLRWMDLRSAVQNLPLLNQITNNFPDMEETEMFLLLKEEECRHQAPLLPGQDRIVTVLFHTFATHQIDCHKFHPVACVSKDNSLVASRVTWYWSEENKQNLKHESIFKRINLKVSQFDQRIDLYLFKNDISGPVFNAQESITQLVPFCFHHRGWLHNFDIPTNPSDPLLQSTSHLISSIHLLPSKADYDLHEGIELCTTALYLNTDRPVLLAAQIVDNINDKTPNYTSKGFVPPFVRRGKLGGNEKMGAENFKLALVEPSTEDYLSSCCKAYYFFADISNIRVEMENSNSLSLVVHSFITDPTTTLPWWVSCHHRWATLCIDKNVIDILESERAMNGVRWSICWQDDGDTPECFVEFILKYKRKSQPFLLQMEQEDIDALPFLDTLLNPPEESIQNIQQEIHHPHILAEPSTNHPTTEEVDYPSQISDAVYREAVTKLGEDVMRLRQEKENLERENNFLQGQVTQLVSFQESFQIDPTTKRDLEAMLKPDLVHKILALHRDLELERQEKNSYRQKVYVLQNELIQSNDTEREFIALQEAHKEQQVFVQELQRKVEKYRKCYETSLQQENIIAQFESLFSQLPKEIVAEQHTSNHDIKNREEISTLNPYQEEEEMHHSLEEQLWMATQRIGELENVLTQTQASQIQNSLVAVLEQSAAREHQLQQSLQNTNIELAKLREENRKLYSKIASVTNMVQKRVKPMKPQPSQQTATQSDLVNSISSEDTKCDRTVKNSSNQKYTPRISF